MRLAGITFCRNAMMYDYNIVETIQSLLGFCDRVFVVLIRGNDETEEIVKGIAFNNYRITIIDGVTAWESTDDMGKERLSHYTNIGVRGAQGFGYNYQFVLQADEVVHESSYPFIRKAIETSKDGFMCTRINLWGSPYRYLHVPTSRQPCSTEVMRLTKTGLLAYDDAENIGCDNPDFSFLKDIRIYHMGFVRRRSVMKAKVSNMQKNVFGMEHHDPKLDMEDQFNPWLWFDKDKDTSVINEPLPEVIREWAKWRAIDYEQ